MSDTPEVRFSTRCVIGGRSVDAKSGETFETLNPANGQVLTSVSLGAAVDIDLAVLSARKAFSEGPWPRMSPAERKSIMLRFAAVVEAHSDELALMEALEAGKPITDCMEICLLYTSPSPRDKRQSRMPSSA